MCISGARDATASSSGRCASAVRGMQRNQAVAGVQQRCAGVRDATAARDATASSSGRGAAERVRRSAVASALSSSGRGTSAVRGMQRHQAAGGVQRRCVSSSGSAVGALPLELEGCRLLGDYVRLNVDGSPHEGGNIDYQLVGSSLLFEGDQHGYFHLVAPFKGYFVLCHIIGQG